MKIPLLLVILFFYVCTYAGKMSFSNSGNAPINSSVLSSGRWIKVKTKEKGVHKITYRKLKEMGFSNPDNVDIYGNGGFLLSKMNNDTVADDLIRNAVWYSEDGTGNECLFFYTPGTVRWTYNPDSQKHEHEINSFSENECFYFLTESAGPSNNIEFTGSDTGQISAVAENYDCYRFYEEEKNNLLKSGRLWLGQLFTGGSGQGFEFEFSSRITGEPIIADISLAGRSTSSFESGIKINGHSLGEIQFTPYTSNVSSAYAELQSGVFEYNGTEDDIIVEIQNSGNSTSQSWLNYIRLNTRCRLNMAGSQMCFRDSRTVGPGNITEFRIGNASSPLQVWDITNCSDVKGMTCSFSGQNISFTTATDQLREFIVFDPSGDIPTVEVIGEIENQNIHSTPPVEMIIVTHPEFLNEAARLAQFHRDNDNISVEVVLTSQIYNEFSGGIADVAAIRNYLRMVYSRSEGVFKYLLLFGNGTYNSVNKISESNPNFIPTWQSEESLIPSLSFVSDDFYGLLDENEGEYYGAVDIGIGRIPCENKDEAAAAVDKIINYVSPECMGEWRNVICFIADDEDGNIHMRDAEKMADQIHLEYPEYITRKIYFDSFVQETSPEERYPDVTEAINEQIKKGALIVNYTGHANDEVLAHEKVLTKDNIDSWTNYNRLPVFVTATCEFSRWDYCDKRSAGEHILFNKNGGGIALFSTTRLVYSSSNYNINKEFFEHAFEHDENGKPLRLGDIISQAKIQTGGGVNSRKFALLGDPALKLGYPEHSIKTLSVNGIPSELFTDTLNALDAVEIKGEVQDNKGNKLSGFSGELFAVVYDKPVIESTLGNDGAAFDYIARNNTLFTGDITVEDGEFSFSFIVPKDIDYSVGEGEVRYYAGGKGEDANGYYKFKIGGSTGKTIADNEGPRIELYLENENFVSGDRTHENPLMIAHIADDTGINTARAGIGHDVSLVINHDENNPVILNEFFRFDADSYKTGNIYFQLFDLPEGYNTIRLTAWDVLNNSSFTEVEFDVVSELTLENLINYPNPMQNETHFSFEHNRYDELFHVKIEIFDINGTPVDLIETEAFSNGNKIEPILWSPADHGLALRNGVYLYRITLTTGKGLSVSSGDRIIVLK